jgi:uncharacterized delta-60 repeat protein
VRFNTNGTLDTTFGASTGHPGYVSLAGLYNPAVGVQSNDRVVVAGVGTDTPTGHHTIGLDRLNPDGTMDTSFGSGGAVATSSPPNDDNAKSVAILADGSIVVAGFQNNTSTGDNSFLAARYNTAGTLDTSFGGNGVATGGSNGHSSIGFVAVEPDGRIVVGGTQALSTTSAFSLARFLAAGPQVGSFSASPSPAAAGGPLTLTAGSVAALNPGSTTTQVAFYLDSNGDGALAPGTDSLLGYGTQDSSGNWAFTFSTAGWSSGTYTLFAQAKDSYGVLGDPLAASVTVI